MLELATVSSAATRLMTGRALVVPGTAASLLCAATAADSTRRPLDAATVIFRRLQIDPSPVVSLANWIQNEKPYSGTPALVLGVVLVAFSSVHLSEFTHRSTPRNYTYLTWICFFFALQSQPPHMLRTLLITTAVSVLGAVTILKLSIESSGPAWIGATLTAVDLGNVLWTPFERAIRFLISDRTPDKHLQVEDLPPLPTGAISLDRGPAPSSGLSPAYSLTGDNETHAIGATLLAR